MGNDTNNKNIFLKKEVQERTVDDKLARRSFWVGDI